MRGIALGVKTSFARYQDSLQPQSPLLLSHIYPPQCKSAQSGEIFPETLFFFLGGCSVNRFCLFSNTPIFLLCNTLSLHFLAKLVVAICRRKKTQNPIFSSTCNQSELMQRGGYSNCVVCPILFMTSS